VEGNTDDLPDTWFKELKSGPKLKPEYIAYEPKPLYVLADGTYADRPEDNRVHSWFLKALSSHVCHVAQSMTTHK